MIESALLDIQQVSAEDYKRECHTHADEILKCEFIFKVDYETNWTRYEVADLDREIIKWLTENVSYAFTQSFYSRTWVGFQNSSDATHFKLMFT